jgi:hypothetical protein
MSISTYITEYFFRLKFKSSKGANFEKFAGKRFIDDLNDGALTFEDAFGLVTRICERYQDEKKKYYEIRAFEDDEEGFININVIYDGNGHDNVVWSGKFECVLNVNGISDELNDALRYRVMMENKQLESRI